MSAAGTHRVERRIGADKDWHTVAEAPSLYAAVCRWAQCLPPVAAEYRYRIVDVAGTVVAAHTVAPGLSGRADLAPGVAWLEDPQWRDSVESAHFGARPGWGSERRW